MTRRYGRGKGGQRMVDHAPLNKPKSTTILSSSRLDGEMAFTTFPGGTTAHPGDIVVMDNLRTHHIRAVGELRWQE